MKSQQIVLPDGEEDNNLTVETCIVVVTENAPLW